MAKFNDNLTIEGNLFVDGDIISNEVSEVITNDDIYSLKLDGIQMECRTDSPLDVGEQAPIRFKAGPFIYTFGLVSYNEQRPAVGIIGHSPSPNDLRTVNRAPLRVVMQDTWVSFTTVEEDGDIRYDWAESSWNAATDKRVWFSSAYIAERDSIAI